MSKSKWIGRALSLALCTVAMSACSQGGTSGNQSDANASASGITLNQKDEKQIREAIAGAPAHGLKPELFLKGDESGPALVSAALKYASALANGYSDPTKLYEVYTIPRAKTDVRAGLQQALQNGNVAEWLNSLAPQTDEYKALSNAFLRYIKLADQPDQKPIPADKPIKPGARDPRIPAIVAVLRSGGYIPEQAQGTADPGAYTPSLVAAVKQFQADSGTKPDGVLGKETIGALSAGPGYRARQLAVAMERLRWLQREPPKTRIDVNTAASFLDYWRDGQHVDHRKVINGEADKPTPQLQAPIVQLVANPAWRVPDGIAAKELANKSASWLASNDYVQKDGKWIQESGPKSSLGRVKFDMQDDEAIYLHDTPAKAAFALPDRHRSHGCVRVENAVQFATALAQQEGILDKFQQAMAKDDEAFIKLPNEIPVRLLYMTAFWDGSRVQFRPDVYGWDENVAKALELAPGPPVKIEQPESSDDIGP
ncbi:MAG TPA: L,D-transpeptidase family protein [Sphingomicrobium sp.]|jgi:murein L,D-transpeptidase YcbB/YkuD|nr:L,D-transpeptidase family protein [Sphingomicrobium sp.]